VPALRCADASARGEVAVSGAMDTLTVLVRLLVSFALGGMIGLERESHRRPAGLRTHILVATGSCLITLVSIYSASVSSLGERGAIDPTRIAANIITGIGFLGAGTILRDGMTVRGLTTAASLWVVAGMGLAVGFGFYAGALAVAILVTLSLVYLDRIEVKYIESKGHRLSMVLEDRPGMLAAICATLADLGINITQVVADESSGSPGCIDVVLGVRLPVGRDGLVAAVEQIRAIPGVHQVKAQPGQKAPE
jgi:putative Mg2+ transporter-C (MgtC) family protein